MSGLLRRIKRSRTADAGEPPAQEQAAAPEGAPTPAGGAEASELPTATADPARLEPAPRTPQPAAPDLQADPSRPAGLEPAEGTPRPAGRRGRLRRRLRYLRRARELMLRDLGGLVYEVHRSGGGDYGAHANVIGGKIERLATLDAEAGAIEEVLGAQRPESVVFQPGVGGTCDVCGELYGSAARFCSNCGSATDPAARPTTAPTAAPSEPRVVPPMPKPPAREEDRPTRELTAAHETAAAADEPPWTNEAASAPVDEQPRANEGASAPADEQPPANEGASAAAEQPPRANEGASAAADEPRRANQGAGAPAVADEQPAPDAPTVADEQPAPDAPTVANEKPAPDAPTAADKPVSPDAPTVADEPGEPGRNPFSGIGNGRPEQKDEPPELSSGDPLAARESRQ